jgi:hypothetical protein
MKAKQVASHGSGHRQNNEFPPAAVSGTYIESVSMPSILLIQQGSLNVSEPFYGRCTA